MARSPIVFVNAHHSLPTDLRSIAKCPSPASQNSAARSAGPPFVCLVCFVVKTLPDATHIDHRESRRTKAKRCDQTRFARNRTFNHETHQTHERIAERRKCHGTEANRVRERPPQSAPTDLRSIAKCPSPASRNSAARSAGPPFVCLVCFVVKNLPDATHIDHRESRRTKAKRCDQTRASQEIERLTTKHTKHTKEFQKGENAMARRPIVFVNAHHSLR